MADGTKIEWTDATWNIITGCSVVSAGCKHCYAMKLAGTRLAHHPSREGLTIDTAAGPVWNGEVRFNDQWLLQPLEWTRPRRIFVCAHGDLFHESVPDEWIDKVFAVMALAPQHTFQVLTKRASRMRQYLSNENVWPRIEAAARRIYRELTGRQIEGKVLIGPLPHIWLGVSVEDQAAADARIPDLLCTPAVVRWISAEPLLGAVDLMQVAVPADEDLLRRPWDFEGYKFNALQAHDDDRFHQAPAALDWVVIGGESGAKARPMSIQWARELRDQCASAGVPFLFKQWGEWAPAGCRRPGERGAFAFGDYEHARSIFHVTDSYPRPFTAFGARCVLERVGKKRAGRKLDGAEHNGFPEVRHG